jgi:hypothetical protein
MRVAPEATRAAYSEFAGFLSEVALSTQIFGAKEARWECTRKARRERSRALDVPLMAT